MGKHDRDGDKYSRSSRDKKSTRDLSTSSREYEKNVRYDKRKSSKKDRARSRSRDDNDYDRKSKSRRDDEKTSSSSDVRRRKHRENSFDDKESRRQSNRNDFYEGNHQEQVGLTQPVVWVQILVVI